MKIGQLAERTGLTAHTIRYYERIGLLPYAARDRSGQRAYDGTILPWIEFLRRMKTAGMPIREMVRYARLRAQGSATAPERKELLVRHRQRIRTEIAELRACLSVLDKKIATYGRPETAEKTTDDANGKSYGQPLRTRPARADGNRRARRAESDRLARRHRA